MKEIIYHAEDQRAGMTGEEMADNLRDAEQVQKLEQPMRVKVKVGFKGQVKSMIITGGNPIGMPEGWPSA